MAMVAYAPSVVNLAGEDPGVRNRRVVGGGRMGSPRTSAAGVMSGGRPKRWLRAGRFRRTQRALPGATASGRVRRYRGGSGGPHGAPRAGAAGGDPRATDGQCFS